MGAAASFGAMTWDTVWRDGFMPSISAKGLRALAEGLRSGDTRLVQGETTSPPPLMCVRDWAVDAACAVGFCGWQGEGLATVSEVEDYFARVCFEADRRLGEPAACRWFLNWWDETPRGEAAPRLLAEVEAELARRGV